MARKQQATLTRADRVRQRRESTPQRRSGRVKTRTAAVHAAAGAPVVVSRYGVIGEAAMPPAGRVRKQVRLPRGAHTELVASLPGVSLGWRWLSLLLTVFLIASIAALWYAPVFRVGVPEIRGVHYLAGEQVARRLGVANRPVVALDPALLARQVEALPAIAHAEVRVAFPNRVVVTVQERQPVLVWRSGNETWWVDKDGLAFAPPVASPPAHVLVVQADALPAQAAEVRPGEMQMLSTTQVKALQTLARYLPAGTVLMYHPRYGLGWKAPEGWQVFVGQQLTQMQRRMALYEAIARWLKAKGIHPALVDVASMYAPYYRMEP